MKNLLIALGLWAGLVSQAEAKEYPELTQFVMTQTAAMRDALQQFEGEEPFLLASQFELKRFLLRIRMKVGFDIADFGKIEVIPELELVFQKEKVAPPKVT